jgi:hypothetical protein
MTGVSQTNVDRWARAAGLGSGKVQPTRAVHATFAQAISDLTEADQPTSDRFIYYRAVSAGLIEKDRDGDRDNYNKIIRTLGSLRENGEMPWEWIKDGTRSVIDLQSAPDAPTALRRLAEHSALGRSTFVGARNGT